MTEDAARVSVSVAVPPAMAFEIFTNEIDRWWRRGMRFRRGGPRGGFIRLEPGVGGRLFESIDGDAGPYVHEVGRVTAWEPPHLLAFTWRAANFAPHESTSVEVRFTQNGRGTLVSVTHSGWSSLRPDHPVRHGREGADFYRMIGLWWGEQMRSLREHAHAHAHAHVHERESSRDSAF
jgi:uncharacterized protein YndB with AHSA1/START domain